jgi:serine/threonine protein kinase
MFKSLYLLSANFFPASCFRYKIIKEVGDGTFGSVWRAINKESGEVVCHSTCPNICNFVYVMTYYFFQ